MKKLLLLLFLSITVGACAMEPIKEHKILGERPAHVQAAVDSAFEYNKSAKPGEWLRDGSYGYYGLLNIDEDALLKHIANENTEEKDVYIIDVGCAQGGWGRNVLRTLEKESIKKTGKRFHIFSVTGGKECKELVEHKGHVTLYQLSNFKIENIDEEFSKRGFNLKNKVNLIVSHWTLRHLVDPFGTVKRLYSLLTPKHGMLMSNGFLFSHDKNDEVQAFPAHNSKDYNANILMGTNAICLFRHWTCSRDVGEFLLVRTHQKELNIPLEYTGQTRSIGNGYQNSSQQVTVFNKGNSIKDNNLSDGISWMNNDIYFDKDDMRSKNLFRALLYQKLFYKNNANL